VGQTKHRKTCEEPGCQARAWQGSLCNLHALEHYRGKARMPPAERLALGKKLLRQRARELGIVLADEKKAAPSQPAEDRREVVTMGVGSPRPKARYPRG